MTEFYREMMPNSGYRLECDNCTRVLSCTDRVGLNDIANEMNWCVDSDRVVWCGECKSATVTEDAHSTQDREAAKQTKCRELEVT